MAEDARDTPNIEETARVIDAGNLKGDSDRRTQVDRAMDIVLVGAVQNFGQANNTALMHWAHAQKKAVEIDLNEATASRIAGGVSLPQTAQDDTSVISGNLLKAAETIRGAIELLRSPTPTPPPVAP